jgi:putative zinc finger protein
VTPCEEFRALAPELALGVLDGDERADAIAHLSACAECRTYTDQLSEVGDSLLLLTPPADPPLGFESRVVASLARADHPHRRRRSWIRTAAIAAAAAIVATLVTAGLVGGGERDSLLRGTLASARSGGTVGRVWAYDASGGRDWMFVTIDNPWAANNPYVCEAVLRDGRTVRLGRFEAHEGKGAWGEPVSVPVRDITSVRVVNEGGTVVASAPIES